MEVSEALNAMAEIDRLDDGTMERAEIIAGLRGVLLKHPEVFAVVMFEVLQELRRRDDPTYRAAFRIFADGKDGPEAWAAMQAELDPYLAATPKQ